MSIALSLPFKGLQVIEASAGTGKTWTLAALYVRLVLGHGLDASKSQGLNPPEILVMTFTDLATAELRGRIRERLHQAAVYFQLPNIEDPCADEFLRELKKNVDSSNWAHCAKRLELSAQWMDEAAIFTIHSWSARMLKEHAFDSKSLFDQSLNEDGANLRVASAQEYWRRELYPLSTQQISGLEDYPASPKDLLDKLSGRFYKKDRSPQDHLPQGVAPKVALKDWDTLKDKYGLIVVQARQVWTEATREHIKTNIFRLKESGLFGKYRKDLLSGWFNKMLEWHKGGEIELKTLERFSLKMLQDNGWQEAIEIPSLEKIDELCEILKKMSELNNEDLLDHAAYQINEIYESSKAKLGQFDFTDLLKNLYFAVNAQGSKLAQTIRTQYPVALVDEFQDTDPWQYGTLRKIYVEEGNFDSSLIIIGDPKQAIYGFRGADLDTYLKATKDAQENIHTLQNNFRSTKGLVNAVNHIFSVADRPFKTVDFHEVNAAQDIPPLIVGNIEQAAITVFCSKSDEPLSSDQYKREMSSVFASFMVKLLNSKAAQPNEIAVLVKDMNEANSIRGALTDLGVRSVYLSEKDSVYNTQEAADLRLWMLAVSNPKSPKYLRSAVSTRCWGFSFQELEQIINNESEWEMLIERFHEYQLIWQAQGFLPMLHKLLHENKLPQRILNSVNSDHLEGERVLTNLLHLGDLLQTASLRLHGEVALVRYLEQQIRDPRTSGDSAIVRLESEANLIKVITIHKSKGLEFPLVFLPFISNFRVEKKTTDAEKQKRLEEDIRLMYVALTRAQKALWLGLATIKSDFTKKGLNPKSAISVLLGRQSTSDLREKLNTMWESCTDILIKDTPVAEAVNYQITEESLELKSARTPKNNFISNWWTASFSSISKGSVKRGADVYYPESYRDDRRADSQDDNDHNLTNQEILNKVSNQNKLTIDAQDNLYTSLKSSSTFGTLLHDLLEWQFNHDWPISSSSAKEQVSFEWTSMINNKSFKLGFGEDQKNLLISWIKKIVTTELAGEKTPISISKLSLDKLNHQNAWAEMAFTLPINEMSVSRLDEMITKQVLPNQLRSPLQARQMNGMLTGFMDLVFEHEGLYYVLDYKSNFLNNYSINELTQSILDHRYDVQYTLYLVALHRLLKFRLDDYEYDTHMGGAVYMYLRGVNTSSRGIFVDRPPKELILSIDNEFKGCK